jgi:tetratricopeptide (TPR) repeat protein
MPEFLFRKLIVPLMNKLNHSQIKVLLITAFAILFAFLSQNNSAQKPEYEKYFLFSNYDSIIYTANERILETEADFLDYYWLSVALDKKGDLFKSTETLVLANVLFENDLIKKSLAEKYFQTGNYPLAKQFYLDFYAEDIPPGEWIYNLSSIYEFENRYDSAVYYLSSYLLSDSLNYRTLVKIADNYHRLNEPDSTISYLLKANKIIQLNYYTSRLLANAYLKVEKYHSAIRICNQILEHDSLNLNFLKLKAFAYYQMDLMDEAAELYSRVVSLGDSSLLTYKRLGLSLIDVEEYDSAVNVLDLALQQDTTDYELYVSMGTAMARTLNKVNSVKYFNRALILMEPDTAVVAFILENQANVIRETLSYQDALALYLQVNELKPELPRILYAIGDLYMALDQYEESIQYFEKIITIMEKRDSPGNLKSELIYNLSKRNIRYIKEEKFFEGK